MEKTRINLDILLPEVPDKRDECVNRIIHKLQYKRGIDKVHIMPEEPGNEAQLCFHYDPSEISLSKVEKLAKDAGAEITERFGHLLVNVFGIRQQHFTPSWDAIICFVSTTASFTYNHYYYYLLLKNGGQNSGQDYLE